MATRYSYSLRHQTSLAAGGLLVLIVFSGCIGLGLAQRRQQQARLLALLHAQERSAWEVTRAAEELAQVKRLGQRVADDRLDAVRERLNHLAQSFQVFERGGELVAGDGRAVRVEAAEELMGRQLRAIRDWIALYQGHLQAVFSEASTGSVEPPADGDQETIRYGRELRKAVQGLAVGAESQFLDALVRAGAVQLALMLIGILVFFAAIWLHRSLVTVPLHRMVDAIQVMQRMQRWATLPVRHANELGVVVSAFNQLAEQVADQQRRLREHVVELQRVNVELEQLTNVKDDFLMTINHQLRTPLTPILEGIELLGEQVVGPLSEQQLALVGMMEENASRLADLVDGALNLSLLKSGRRPLQRRPADLAALLSRAQGKWTVIAKSRTIRLSCPALPPVYMDEEAIGELVDHLVHNALRHAPEGSEVAIEASARETSVQCSVSDQGPGLSAQQVDRLFEPFIHVHTPDAPGSEGSGLGLAFCRQVIERHHGTIRAASSGGRGTRVTIELPVASPHFLLEDAYRGAKEEAEYERGRLAVLLVAPAHRRDQRGAGGATRRDADSTPGTSSAQAAGAETAELMSRTQDLLSRNTHRGDRLVRVDDGTLAIVAVTDRAGLEAMVARLRAVLGGAGLPVRVGCTLHPDDGDNVDRLLEVARERLLDGDGTDGGGAGPARSAR